MVFNSDMDASDANSADVNSYSVYDLLPYTQVDAVVVMAETIQNQVVVDAICESAAAAKVPVLSYDGILRNYPSVYCYPSQAFSRLLDHVLTVHNCCKIDLLTGVRGNYGSECIVSAYQDALQKHGLTYDPARVEYGDYQEGAAAFAVERLLALDTPEAIICANDTMAIACCSVLKRHGLRVPEDVIVTGLDGIVRERYHTPRLTTCKRDLENMSIAFFDMAEMVLAGEVIDHECEIPAVLQASESCGCAVMAQQDANEIVSMLHNQIQTAARQESDASRIFGTLLRREKTTVIDYLDVLADRLPERGYLCLRDCLAADSAEGILHSFADSSELMSTVTVQKSEKRYALLPRGSLIPDLESVVKSDRTLYVSSIYFQQDIYGYYAYYGGRIVTEAMKWPKFLHTAGNAIGASLNMARVALMNERLLSARIRDSLTGMLNLNGTMRSLAERVEACGDTPTRIVMVVIGLKNLRQINSIFGHLEGDQALLGLSGAIIDCIDSDAVSGRVGGDEFLVTFFSGVGDADSSDAMITVLMNRLHSYNQVSGKNYSLDIAIGKVAARVTPSLSLDGMLNEAMNLKDKKRRSDASGGDGQHNATLQDPVAAQVEEVLNRNLLTYHFQPIVSGRTGQIYAYEALMRTTGGYKISPLNVLQYATMMGRLYEVEWLTYCNVLRIVRENETQFRGKKVFINSIPGHFITDADFNRLLDLYSDLLPMLVVEFTEQAEADGDELKQMQNRCSDNNMEIAVDDYGTGYSNISNLLRYSPNYVKIDRTLISNIHEEPKKQHFVTNIIEFAHANGFQALAEGVETIEEMRAVIRFGIDLIQGNYTAQPAAAPLEQISEGTLAIINKVSQEAAKQFVRKTYMPNNRQAVRLSKLSAANYTDIFIAQPYVELTGDFNVTAGLTIRFKEGTTSHLVLHDAHLCSTNSAPCIVLGKNTNVTLEIRGDNRLDHGGIFVPDSASLHLTGRGNLTISVNDARSSAIGSDIDSTFGDINVDLAGCLQINTNGEQCIGIGGGSGHGQKLAVCGTKVFFQTSGVESISLGAAMGECDITLVGCMVNLESRFARGVGIGIETGTPTITLNTASVEMNGSGKTVAVVGSLNGGGNVVMKDSSVRAAFNAQDLVVVGSRDGAPKIKIKNSELDIKSEGRNVVDIGSETEDAEITVADTSIMVNAQSAKMMHLAAAEDKKICTGLTEIIRVNEE